MTPQKYIQRAAPWTTVFLLAFAFVFCTLAPFQALADTQTPTGNSSVLPTDLKGITAPTSSLVNPAFLDLQTGLPVFYNAALFVATVVFVILVIIGGVRYLASAGGDGTEQAKKLLLSAVVGLALILGTWAILLLVFQLTGYHFGN